MCAVCIVQVRKQDFHRVVEPQKIQTGREFVSSCSQQGQLWVQTWLLRALSQWMLKISKTAAFLGSLTHCWTVLKVKKFLFESNMNVSWPSLWPLSLFLPPHIWERSGSTSSIISLKVFGKLLLKPSLLQVLSLRASSWSHRASSPTVSTLWILSWIHSNLLMSFFLSGDKNWTKYGEFGLVSRGQIPVSISWPWSCSYRPGSCWPPELLAQAHLTAHHVFLRAAPSLSLCGLLPIQELFCPRTSTACLSLLKFTRLLYIHSSSLSRFLPLACPFLAMSLPPSTWTCLPWVWFYLHTW